MLLHALFCLFTCAPVATEDPIAAYRQAAVERWEEEIRKLEKLDQTEADPEHAILFLGSSSIRLWTELAEDMKPWPTIRRGYGGAKFSDLAVYIDRLVQPHQFDALVVFVANDISGKDADKTPPEVLRLVRYTVQKVRQKNPHQPIFFIAITPTSSRFAVWEKIREANRLIQEYSATDETLHYIDTAAHYLGSDGKPRDELFRKDQLHLNRDGYRIWATLIRAKLEEVLGKPQS